MLDFPASPNPGDQYLSYVWDGTKWGVQAGVGGVAGVASFNTRTGQIVTTLADITAATGTGATAQTHLGLASVAASGAYADLSGAPAPVPGPQGPPGPAGPPGPLTGTTTNDNAVPGNIGEFQSAQRLSTAAIALTTNVSAIIATLSLTAGDWDVWAVLGCNTTTSTGNPVVRGWINPAGGATPPSLDQFGGNAMRNPTNAATQLLMAIPAVRISLSVTTSVTLGATVTFGNGTYAGWGQVMARRRR